MAILAGIATGNVRRVLARGDDAIMAGVAASYYLGVINSHHRREHIRGVAVFTNIRRLNMCRVFADRLSAVMAAETVTDDVYVIEIRGQPACCAVTVVAGVAAGYVRRVLAGGNDAVVAGGTTSNHLRVIDGHDGRKHIRGVAVVTDIRRLDVCRVLTGCVRTVVAAKTVAGDVQVIEIRGQPADCAVAVIAIVTAGYMRRVLAAGNDAVVAGATTPDHLGVVDSHHGCKCSRGVAVLTDIGRLNVFRVLARCVRTVVTGATSTQNLCVIDRRHGRKHIRGMAVFTDICRLRMCWVFARRCRAVVTADTVTGDIHVIEIHR